MPRSSRHRSHKRQKRSSKDLKEHTDSEEEESLRERKTKEDSGIKVSRDSESVLKRKSPSQLQSRSQLGKDLDRPGDGNLSGDHGTSKRRRDKADSSSNDRWDGGGDERAEGLVGEKGGNGEGFGRHSEKVPHSKVSVDSKSSSSRRHESSSEGKEVLMVESEEAKKGSSKVESKRKSEKDSSRRETYQHKDAKEKDRGSERDKQSQEVRRERTVDVATGKAVGGSNEVSRKQGTQMGAFEDECQRNRQVEITEWQIQDELRNPELEKELEKRIRRRDGSGDRDNKRDDVRDGDGTRFSSRDDHLKNGRYKDERHNDGRYREKYREDNDRDCRYQDDKHRDERSSRDRTSDRSDHKNFRDESKPSENHHKKTKLQDSDHDDSYRVDERSIRNKDSMGRKGSTDVNEDHSDIKSRSFKDQPTDFERNALSGSKLDSLTNKGRSESLYHHTVVTDSAPTNTRSKDSPISGVHTIKDGSGFVSRHGSKQVESSHRNSSSDERLQLNTAPGREFASAFRGTKRISKSRPMENLQNDDSHVDELSLENASASIPEISPKSDHMASPIQSTEKSPSTSGDRLNSNGTGMKWNIAAEEMGRRSSSSKDARDYSISECRGSELTSEKPLLDDLFQAELLNEDLTLGSACSKRAGNFTCSSPSLLPPPPCRVRVNSPSVLGSLEEDSMGPAGERKFNNRYKRSGDHNMEKGQGNVRKGAPNWPSPVSNGFIPFQHGLPPSGFQAVVPQSPATPLFGIGPSMELSHTGVSYHMHDTDRFSSHVRPFGWHNPAGNACPSHLHGWEGSNGVFGDESHIFRRPDWDQNRHLMSSQGWEVSADMWKGQNGTAKVEFPAPQKELGFSVHATADETWAGQSSHCSHKGWNRPECLLPESTGIKRSDVNGPSAKTMGEAPPKDFLAKMPEPSKLLSDDGAPFCHIYLSKLDISMDLVRPELYKQCVSLLKTEERTIDASNSLMHIDPEEDPESGAKSFNHSLRETLFPFIAETTFQRAMTLYKKQNAESKGNNPFSSLAESKLEKGSPASDEVRAERVDCSSVEHALPATVSPCHDETGDGSTNSPGYEESSNGTSNSEGDLSGDSEKRPPDTISSGVLVGESHSYEDLMLESIECTVNLSRMHNPPESTH